MKYRKKPVTIEAIQWDGDNLDEVREFVGDSLVVNDEGVFIETLEGRMEASPKDFIIKGVHGEFYPCKPDIFWKTYDVEPENFMDRLLIERNELSEKVDKLHKFISMEDFPQKVSSTYHRELLQRQLHCLREYLLILDSRIKLLL